MGEETPETDPFLIEVMQAWITGWKPCKIPKSEEAMTELRDHVAKNPTEGWTGMDKCDDETELKQVVLPRLLIAPEATRPSTTPGEAASFLAKWKSQQKDTPPTLTEKTQLTVSKRSARWHVAPYQSRQRVSPRCASWR